MKVKFSKLIISIIITTSTLLLTSCSNQSSSSQQHHANPSVALVTDASDANSNPYNAAAIAGLKKYAQDHNLNSGDNGYEVFTPNYSSEIYSLVDQAAQKNFHLVIGMGSSLQNAIRDNAKLYPKINFAIIDGKVNNQKNVTNINFQSQQAAYLAGIVAAKTTKTNVIGFIGGTQQSSTKFKNGFIQGIQDQAKKDHKKIKILSQNTNTFSDTNVGQNIAQAMYLKKADIIFAASGESGNGVFTAARKINEAQPINQKVWVIGVDTDQTNQGDYYAKGGQKSNFTLTSVTNNIALAIKNIATDSYNDKFPGNKTTTYSLKNKGVDIVQSSNISYNVWIAVQKARQKILNGEIKIK
ncbi:BMP family ABC transporter substrate-binding protein [Lactobacillus sp.]|uniref:BMP family lipoprotein n=1 Tax=Lactobacillus sp. TaxID=1591 RepID=UPI0019C9C823|nr:BMP family ABC transporter substrate-binding protein [Lactobacillus sp.]MBD5429438.1 BMP family ABC transporter substrate-binding protein [Lactobacillus sp.]